MKHVVIYVPGLGDRNGAAGRRIITAGWWLYGVRPIVHAVGWSDGKPFEDKLQGLLQLIDTRTAKGHTVSLVGESAGASAAMHAYARRQDSVHRVACICGKLRGPVHSYHAFEESMERLPQSLSLLDSAARARIRSIRPLRDPVVPVADTVIPGAESVIIPTSGHAGSIVLGTTIFSHRILGFIKRPLNR